MPGITLDPVDAAELAEVLTFLTQWLSGRQKHALAESPALSALLPALPGVSRLGLRSAPARLLRQPGGEVSHLLRFPAPHGAQAPRGAQVFLDGHVAVVKGQLAGPQAAADQEVVARGGNAQARPRVPAVPFRSLPAERISQRRASFSSRVTACAQAG
jgi:hypothetical protein